MSETPKVYAAIAAATAALGRTGIGKGRHNQQQGFAFRGIDDVFNALSSVLSTNKICIIPRVVNRQVTERQTQNNKALFYVVLEVEFDIVCAEDGSSHMARVCGEAMDSGDKATNKAMSAAYKYMAFQLFCIPTEANEDADATTHDVAASAPPPPNSDELNSLLIEIGMCDSVEQLRKLYADAGKLSDYEAGIARNAARQRNTKLEASK